MNEPTYEELKQRVNELQDSVAKLTAIKDRYEKLVDNLPQIIVETDLEGTLTYANKKAIEATGYTKEDIDDGINAVQFVVSEERYRVIENMQRILKGETLEGNEYTALRKDGSTYPVLVYTSYKIENGQKAGLRSIIVDISEKKNEEIKKANLIAELQKTLKQVRVLSGLIPICASCKQIRDDKGFWNQIEKYISEHSDAVFSHSICPSCAQKLYPDFNIYGDEKK